MHSAGGEYGDQAPAFSVLSPELQKLVVDAEKAAQFLNTAASYLASDAKNGLASTLRAHATELRLAAWQVKGRG